MISDKLSLDELWLEAEKYGRPRLSRTDRGSYYACIEFDTIQNVKLTADSDFVNGPHKALAQAIAKAVEIVQSLDKVKVDATTIEGSKAMLKRAPGILEGVKS